MLCNTYAPHPRWVASFWLDCTSFKKPPEWLQMRCAPHFVNRKQSDRIFGAWQLFYFLFHTATSTYTYVNDTIVMRTINLQVFTITMCEWYIYIEYDLLTVLTIMICERIYKLNIYFHLNHSDVFWTGFNLLTFFLGGFTLTFLWPSIIPSKALLFWCLIWLSFTFNNSNPR